MPVSDCTYNKKVFCATLPTSKMYSEPLYRHQEGILCTAPTEREYSASLYLHNDGFVFDCTYPKNGILCDCTYTQMVFMVNVVPTKRKYCV